MDVFGSREGDPLLQDDPFAPSDDEEDGASDTSSESAETTEQSPDASSSEPPEAEGDTVFDAVPPPSSVVGEEDDATRVLVRSAQAAAEGRLAELNAAFDQGWRLASVNLQPEMADAPSSEERSLTFVLRDDTSAEDTI